MNTALENEIKERCLEINFPPAGSDAEREKCRPTIRCFLEGALLVVDHRNPNQGKAGIIVCSRPTFPFLNLEHYILVQGMNL